MTAGSQYEGWHCAKCHEEIQRGDEIDVSLDADSDGDGGWYDLSTATHCVCPEGE